MSKGTSNFTVRLDLEIRQLLQVTADREQLSISDVIRKAILAYCKAK